MKILITGASGLIGSSFVRAFSGDEVHATFLSHPSERTNVQFHHLDISDKQDVLSLLSSVNPDLTIHTAAVPSMDICETNKPLADKVNVEGTKNVADACSQFRGKIVFISTSYVFEGNGKSFSEDSLTGPVNYYGLTKLQGEKIISTSGLPFLILRTDQPYGWVEPFQKKNSVVRALEFLENGQQLREPQDWYNTPTFVEDIAAAAKILIEKNLTGIYHVVGPDYLNRYEWSKRVAEVFSQDSSLVKPFNSRELNLPAKRMNARLSTAKLAAEGIKMSSVVEGLEKMEKERQKQ